MTTPLPDGVYDAFVIDVHTSSDGQDLEVTVLTGEFKGLVAVISSSDTLGDEIDLIGMPATVVVADGQPTIRIDP